MKSQVCPSQGGRVAREEGETPEGLVCLHAHALREAHVGTPGGEEVAVHTWTRSPTRT